nr:LCP family protein [Anaerolineae bacterium]
RPPRRDGRNWLARVVERIQFRRAVITLVALTLVADVLLGLSVWLGSASGTPVQLLPTEAWPTPELVIGPTTEPTALPSPTAGPASPAATAVVPPTAAPSPTPIPPTPAPTPSPIPLGPDDINLLLLGTDLRQGKDTSWRTDTMIVVAIRPQMGRVAMLSIPRDLWVTIPGYGQNRINVSDYWGERTRGPGGGPALLGAVLQQSFGIPVHAYARVNFDGLVRIIDALGGVTVTVARPFDEWIDDADGTPLFHLRLSPGQQHMDGLTALNYCRSRHGSSDMDRSKRQQQVLMAMRDAALRPEVLPRLPGLVSALSGTVTTNLQAGQVLSLLKLAVQFKTDAYRRQVFDYTMMSDWTTPAGAQVLLPNRARIMQVWAEMTAE